MDVILLQESSPPQMYLHAQVANILFMVQVTHLGFVLDSVRINLHTILYSTVKSYKCEGVGQIIYFIFEATALEYSGWEVCHP